MKVKFITLGCKVNQYETQELRERFASVGISTTKAVADIYVINSCSVTRRADSKTRDAVMRSKKENPEAKVILCGCFVVDNKDAIKSFGVDCAIEQDQKHRLVEIVLGKLAFKEVLPEKKARSSGITFFPNHRAFVKIQDGCDNFCSFCKIPYLRGPSRSRDFKDIIEECQRLISFHKEIVLCGVNIGLYGRDLKSVPTLKVLICEILALPGLGRLRLSSLEPYFVDVDFFSLLKDKCFCNHFHFPFQYADDRVLKAMNKKETVSLYLDKVKRARAVDPDVAISCDIMVGFPSETDETFENTFNFLKQVSPMRMHIFTFSPREKTPLAKVKLSSSKKVKKRYQALKQLSGELSDAYQQKFIGKILTMVTEQYGKGYTVGCTENYLKVYVQEKIPLGELVKVKIVKLDNERVYGSLLD